MRCLSILILSILVSASSPAQAFDCTKASTETEKLICSDSGLKQADDDLGRAWRKVRELLGEAEFKILRQNQRAWLKTRDARCGYGSDAERVDCLLQQTTQRTLIIAAKTEDGAGKRMPPWCRSPGYRRGQRRLMRLKLPVCGLPLLPGPGKCHSTASG